jgi:hypothetical protein
MRRRHRSVTTCLNLQAYSVFDAVNGPWNLPWFEQNDGAVHLTAAGNGPAAAMLASDLQRWLRF